MSEKLKLPTMNEMFQALDTTLAREKYLSTLRMAYQAIVRGVKPYDTETGRLKMTTCPEMGQEVAQGQVCDESVALHWFSFHLEGDCC